MKVRGFSFFTVVFTTVFSLQGVQADAGSPTTPNDIPCLPAVYSQMPSSCLLVGPAAVLTGNAAIQAELARQDEWLTPIDASLGEAPYRYAKLTSSSKPRIFSSLEAAVEGKNPSRTLNKGFSYITYNGISTVGGKRFYNIGGGQWMRSGDIERHITPTSFSGVEVRQQPSRPFGWVLTYTNARIEPGNSSPVTTQIPRHTIVQVFDRTLVGDYEWYLVGPGQWIEQRSVALVYPRREPPAGVDNGRWIELNLFEQTTAVYEDGQMIFATLTTSGSKAYYTRPGLFKIYERLDVTPMSGAVEADRSDYYYLEGVPWTMFFDQRRAFHGEYWHDHLGYRSSHGCANLSFADAEWLYHWAEIGDWVYVWDPSGETPVIPELFTALLPGARMDEMREERLEGWLK